MHFTYFFLAFFISCLASFGVGFLMRRFGIVDRPKREAHKIHHKKIPLGGGLALFIGFFSVLFFLLRDGTIGADISSRVIAGLCVGSVILMIGGILDDRRGLSPGKQLLFVAAAALSMILSGLDFHAVSNPFGQAIRLDVWTVPLGSLGTWAILSDVVVFFWLSGMMMTTKVLDGLDGLVTGMVCIGALLLYVLSRTSQPGHGEAGLIALVFAGACLGFLIWNFYPAKIFLGQGGSLFTGFVLAALAILSDGKIATTLLVMGIPVLDLLRVVCVRLWRRRPVFSGDTAHLHHQLLYVGLSHRQAVLLLYVIAFLFGITAIFAQNIFSYETPVSFA